MGQDPVDPRRVPSAAHNTVLPATAGIIHAG